jgi:DNA-binding MarR family transcriptional regulator
MLTVPAPDTQTAPRATYLVKRLELAVRGEIERLMRPLGLTTHQYTALSVLARHPGLSSAQLARRSFISPQAANEIVSMMERKGLVVREADPRNRRILRMSLTDAGEVALRAGDELVDELEDRMFARLRHAEVEMFRSTLEMCLSEFTGADHH